MNAKATGVTVLCMHWNLEQILCKFQQREGERGGRRETERESAHTGKPEANPGAPLPTRAKKETVRLAVPSLDVHQSCPGVEVAKWLVGFLITKCGA